jgi:hypothetical protein
MTTLSHRIAAGVARGAGARFGQSRRASRCATGDPSSRPTKLDNFCRKAKFELLQAEWLSHQQRENRKPKFSLFMAKTEKLFISSNRDGA